MRPPSSILTLHREVEVVAGSRTVNTVSAAIAGGVKALVAALQDGKQWCGFPTLAGQSDVWVTAFVTAHIARLPEACEILNGVYPWLASQRRSEGGWSYGGEVPGDADSTAWCLIALQNSSVLIPKERAEAEAFLLRHRCGSGFATFLEDGGIRSFIGADSTQSVAGWTAPHADVTAAALLADVPEGLDILQRLVGRQSGAGFWPAYWWRGPLYTTALLLRAVEYCGYRLPETRACRVLAALDREQLAVGGFGLGASLEPDPFTTALALECYCRLSYLGSPIGYARAKKALLQSQKLNGRWSGDFILRIPAPDTLDPLRVSRWERGSGGGRSYVVDSEGIFATTMACFALEQARKLEMKGPPSPGPELKQPELLGSDEEIVTLTRT